MDEQRLSELRARRAAQAAQRQYADALAVAVGQLDERLGFALTADQALSAQAAELARDVWLAQAKFHQVWHRAWGRQLRTEMLATADLVAAGLEDERAVLLWGAFPTVGFLVPTSLALRALAPLVGPRSDDALGHPTSGDLVLVAEDNTSGLALVYEHLPMADEYVLSSWGRYARSITG